MFRKKRISNVEGATRLRVQQAPACDLRALLSTGTAMRDCRNDNDLGLEEVCWMLSTEHGMHSWLGGSRWPQEVKGAVGEVEFPQRTVVPSFWKPGIAPECPGPVAGSI